MMSLILYFPGMYFIEHVDNILIFARQVPLVEQELLTFPEHLSSTPFFNGVHVSPSLVFSVMLCRSLFVLRPFSFNNRIVFSSI